MAVCPNCGTQIDSGRPFGRLVDSILLIDFELKKELTQDQRITLLTKRADIEMFKRKDGARAYQKSKKNKGKRTRRKKPETPSGTSALDNIFGVSSESKVPLETDN